MDANKLLDDTEAAIRAGDWVKAMELLDQYEYWRAQGGAEPKHGDFRALGYRMQIRLGRRS